MNTQSFGRRVLFLLANVALVASSIVLAAEGAAKKQVMTAEQHATFASKAENVDGTQLHLHHVINCLVGPGGDGFDAKAGNPCKDQGNGALNDMSISMEEQQTLQQVLALAKLGTQIKSYKAAHDTAMAVRDLLEEANMGM